MKKIAVVLISLTLLQGCAVALIAGVSAGAISMNDRRSLDSQIKDQSIEVDAQGLIANNEALAKNTQLQIVSLNSTVLIVGQATNADHRNQAYRLVASIKGVKKVHNQVRIAKLTTAGTHTNDSWITAKVKTELMTDKRLDGSAIKVITEDSEVFLMGLVRNQEATIAVDIARHVNGVARVYKAFEII